VGVEVVLVDMVAEAVGAVAAVEEAEVVAVDQVVQAVMGTGFALTLSLSSILSLIHLFASYATVFSCLLRELLNLYVKCKLL
jgi:hypothetical protein